MCLFRLTQTFTCGNVTNLEEGEKNWPTNKICFFWSHARNSFDLNKQIAY